MTRAPISTRRTAMAREKASDGPVTLLQFFVPPFKPLRRTSRRLDVNRCAGPCFPACEAMRFRKIEASIGVSVKETRATPGPKIRP